MGLKRTKGSFNSSYRKFLRAIETMDDLFFEIFERTTFKIKYTQNFKKFIYYLNPNNYSIQQIILFYDLK